MSYFIERGWAQPGGIEEKIEQIHRPTVTRIVNRMIEGDPLMVITGSLGIGKSESLIPLSRKVLKQAGFRTILKDAQMMYWWQNPNGVDEFQRELVHQDEKLVLIIDEAALLPIKGQQKKILDIAYRNKVQVVAVNAVNIELKEARKKVIEAWISAGNIVCGQKPTSIDIGSPELPREIAKKFLEERFRKRPPMGTPVSQEVIDYILDNIPYNIGLLNIVVNSAIETLPDAMRCLVNNIDNQIGRISKAEAKIIKEKVGDDLWDLMYPKRK